MESPPTRPTTQRRPLATSRCPGQPPLRGRHRVRACAPPGGRAEEAGGSPLGYIFFRYPFFLFFLLGPWCFFRGIPNLKGSKTTMFPAFSNPKSLFSSSEKSSRTDPARLPKARPRSAEGGGPNGADAGTRKEETTDWNRLLVRVEPFFFHLHLFGNLPSSIFGRKRLFL